MEIKSEYLVLYHGSLNELNLRDSAKQYRFAKELNFISKAYKHAYEFGEETNNDQSLDLSQSLLGSGSKNGKNRGPLGDILNQGYSGLVNFHIKFFKNHLGTCMVSVEGTPIIKARK